MVAVEAHSIAAKTGTDLFTIKGLGKYNVLKRSQNNLDPGGKCV